MAAPILLLDVYSLFFRAYHALPPLTTAAGEPTSALYGFATMILKLWREDAPKGAMFAIDPPGPTFRHEAYTEYKATRPSGLPGTLAQQMKHLPELLAAFGFPQISVRGFEADDVLATVATSLAREGESPLVVTGDHDALQLADAPIRVLIVARKSIKDVRYDESIVREKLGVAPKHVPDWKALAGDPSDNLPGVHGIGGKTAASLIEKYGGVDGILAHLAELPARTRSLLEPHREDVVRWCRLATLRRDVPLPPAPWYTPLSSTARAALAPLFERMEFKSLVPRLAALPPSSEDEHVLPADRDR